MRCQIRNRPMFRPSSIHTSPLNLIGCLHCTFYFITRNILFQTETPFECFYFPNQRSTSAELLSACEERTRPRYAALPPTRQDQASYHTLLPPCCQPPPHLQILWTLACVWMHCSTRILLHVKAKKHAVQIRFFFSNNLRPNCASTAAKWSAAEWRTAGLNQVLGLLQQSWNHLAQCC